MDVGIERIFSPQNFSMFLCKQVDDLWATKSEDDGLIVRTISFQDFQTDRWTDDMRSQDCALHYSALHGKNLEN